MEGRPWLVRPVVGIRRPRRPVPGFDVAGTVVEVGAGVTGFAPGDRVFGAGMGSLAEYCAAKVTKLAHVPAGLDLEAAAAVAISGWTALQAVRNYAGVEPGERVLVFGASGGVGSYAVQVAKAAGAVVIGVASEPKLDFVTALGADEVLDHTTTDPLADPGRYDVIIDIAGCRPLRTLRRALTPTGRLVVVGGEGDGLLLAGTDRMLRAQLWSPFVRQSLKGFVSSENAEDLVVLRDLIEAGQVTPAVDRVLPLEEAAEALRLLAAGEVRGKLVVTA
jgi:NADPH:quinone reductase-like Zn-dependent oxidoreductase